MVRSNAARRLAVGTAVGQKAVPAASPTFGVMTSDKPDSAARLLIRQPPAHGAGMEVPPVPVGVVPDSATVAEPADVTIGIDDDHEPACVGRSVTVTVTDCPAAIVAPAAGAPDTAKGAA